VIRAAVRAGAAFLISITVLAGCFGRSENACVKPREYQASRSVEPLQVPEELDQPPAQAVEIPPPPPGASGERSQKCLDEPPDYFGR
jgi:hypothetical protein